MPDATRRFERGTLWRTIVVSTRAARRRGALRPIATRTHMVEDAGVHFQVRVVSSLVHKEADGHAHWQDKIASRRNPFLPYEKDLYVADVSDTHVCLLNKYNVIDHHILVVTRAFEHQESALTPRDFEALGACLAEYEALGFYNSGPAAGASQPHKHIQLVPLPLAGEAEIPIAPVLETALRRGEPSCLGRFPFVHAFVWLDAARLAEPAAWASSVQGLYRTMLAAVGLDPASSRPAPYNLLITRRYMLLVPRVHPRFETVPVNALGFAGSFFVPDPGGLAVIRHAGPVAVLRHVSVENPLP